MQPNLVPGIFYETVPFVIGLNVDKIGIGLQIVTININRICEFFIHMIFYTYTLCLYSFLGIFSCFLEIAVTFGTRIIL